jgi:hypothetical protein
MTLAIRAWPVPRDLLQGFDAHGAIFAWDPVPEAFAEPLPAPRALPRCQGVDVFELDHFHVASSLARDRTAVQPAPEGRQANTGELGGSLEGHVRMGPQVGRAVHGGEASLCPPFGAAANGPRSYAKGRWLTGPTETMFITFWSRNPTFGVPSLLAASS